MSEVEDLKTELKNLTARVTNLENFLASASYEAEPDDFTDPIEHDYRVKLQKMRDQ